MDADSVYRYNLLNSFEFEALNALYLFYKYSQEENWDKWILSRKGLPATGTIKKQKEIASFLNNEINPEMFRPAVNSSGLIIGNPASFIDSFHKKRKDFFDFIC